jgi:cytoskeletal protein CcmA (bactofilin family)
VRPAPNISTPPSRDQYAGYVDMWNQEDTRENKTQPGPAADGAARKTGDGSEAHVPHFGRSASVKGEVSASEDLTIDGQVEGRIDLPDHVLTLGPNAMIMADITVRVATIFGTVIGSIAAREKIDLRKGGSLEGQVTCARLVVQDGASLNAKVEAKGERRPAERGVTTEGAPKALSHVA